ncbi:MAG: FG-GAP-like repeat-containing protein [Bacteroidota bacterium]
MRCLLLGALLVLCVADARAQLLESRALPGITGLSEGTTGACWEDLDADGDLDVVTTHPDGYVRVADNESGSFPERTRFDGFANAATTLCIDLENDGYPDLVVASLSDQIGVLLNRGGAIERTPRYVAGAETPDTRDIDAGDLNGDGFIDLVVARRSGAADVLLYNAGQGTFEAAPTSVFTPDSLNSTGLSLVDIDGDLDLDLLVTALETNRLYVNEGGTLVRRTNAAVEQQRGGISPTWGDWDGDGDLDLYLYGQQEDILYRNDAGRLVQTLVFQAESSATAGAAWVDLDLDGDLDLIQVRNGSAGQVLLNDQGTFTAVSFGRSGINTAIAVTDLEADGRVDALVLRGGFDADQEDEVFTAVPSDNAWLNVRLAGRASNAQGLGAQVFATSFEEGWERRVRPVLAKHGRRGNSATLAHFGLAEAEQVDLEVRWPSGQVQVLKEVEVNQRLTVTESAAPVSVAAVPTSPTRIPADGGRLSYTLRGINFTDEPQTLDLWAYAFRPDGSRFGPVVGPVEVTLEPGARVDEPLRARIAADAPPGTYLGTAYLGDFEAGTVVSESSLHFRKEAGPPTMPWLWTTEFVATGETQEVQVAPANPVATETETAPEAFALAPAFPNPFAATTRLTYTLPSAEHVRLDVFDVLGRRVHVLVDKPQTPGAHAVVWDGRDASGARVANGLYLARLSAGDATATQRLSVAR